MNRPSSSSMAPVLTDYQQRSTNVRLKILKNEEQRIQLEQKLRSMTNNHKSHSYQRKQIQHIQTYFNRLNQESQRAEQRNLQLLNDLTEAQQHLDKLHFDAEHLIHLKNDYITYLESNYPNWQRPTSTRTSTNTSNEYERLAQQIKLESDGNLRQIRQSYDVDSSMLFKQYENQLKIGLDRTISPSNPMINNNTEIKLDEQSSLEFNDIENTNFSRGIRHGSLRMELTRIGLYFLLDYIELELKDTIDKKKFYRLDSPTITQKRTIIDIANEQQKFALKDLDPTTTSMIILDQLSATIRRTTKTKCLLTEEILSLNIQDLDKNKIAQMLHEEDRSLWLRLIDHFTQLLKLHIMNLQILVNKFTITLLPANAFYTHDKAKSLLKHILEKLVGTQSSNSDDEISISKNQSVQHIIPTNSKSSSLWLKKLANGSNFDDDDDDDDKSTSSTTKMSDNNNSDHEFFT